MGAHPFDDLTPAQVAALLRLPPERISFSPREFGAQFGLTAAELMGEIRAGRIKVNAAPFTGRRRRAKPAIIPIRSYLDWIANPKTPLDLLRKVETHLKARPP